MFRRQDLGEQVAEEQFAHAAAQFRGAHDVDQLGRGLADFVDLADFLAEVADDSGGVVEAGVHLVGRVLAGSRDVFTEGIEPLLERVELLLH